MFLTGVPSSTSRPAGCPRGFLMVTRSFPRLHLTLHSRTHTLSSTAPHRATACILHCNVRERRRRPPTVARGGAGRTGGNATSRTGAQPATACLDAATPPGRREAWPGWRDAPRRNGASGLAGAGRAPLPPPSLPACEACEACEQRGTPLFWPSLPPRCCRVWSGDGAQALPRFPHGTLSPPVQSTKWRVTFSALARHSAMPDFSV